MVEYVMGRVQNGRIEYRQTRSQTFAEGRETAVRYAWRSVARVIPQLQPNEFFEAVTTEKEVQ